MWVCVRWSFLSYHLILSKEGSIENEVVYKTLFLMVGNRWSHKKRIPACKLYFGSKLFLFIINTGSYWSIKVGDITIPKLLPWLGFWTEHDVQMEQVEFPPRGTYGHSGLFSMAAGSRGSEFLKDPGSRATWYPKSRPGPSSPHWVT